jgi:linoleate 9S-lipoxygenase
VFGTYQERTMEMNYQKGVKGKVVLMKKSLLDFHDIKANVFDRIHEFFGNGVSIQLISATSPDPGFLILLT